jgi:hypothetical protein
VFPEGTTSNGAALLPFRSGAFRAGLPVQPVLLQYRWTHMSPSWESVPTLWWLWRLLTQASHGVTLTFLPPYAPSPAERAEPRLFADGVRRYMAAALAAEARLARLTAARRAARWQGRAGPDWSAPRAALHALAPLRARRLLLVCGHLPLPAVPLPHADTTAGSGGGFAADVAAALAPAGADAKAELHAAIRAGRLHWQAWHSRDDIAARART